MVCSVAPAGPAGYYLNDRLAASRTWQGPPHQVWLSSIPALEVHEGDALDPRLFTQLARGRRPDGKPLDRRLRQGGRTRWAIDAVFGAPKSLSLLWLESDDRAQLEWAHHDAVVAAMQPLLASDWTARRGAGGALRQPVACPPVAAFLQLAARPSRSEDRPRPHLHSQIVIFNLAERGAGHCGEQDANRWGAVALRDVFVRQKQLTLAYHDKLAANLFRQGVAVERTAQGYVAVADYDRRMVETFSARARDINEASRMAGAHGAALHARIARDTRGAKPRDPDLGALIEQWQAQMAQARANEPAAPDIPMPRA